MDKVNSAKLVHEKIIACIANLAKACLTNFIIFCKFNLNFCGAQNALIKLYFYAVFQFPAILQRLFIFF